MKAPTEPPATDSPLDSLPLHLVAGILCELGSLEHLPNVLLSHPIFYAAFKDFPALARDGLRTQIPDEDVFIHALLSHESKPSKRGIRNFSTTDFLNAYRDNPGKLISCHRFVKLSEALRIGQLHATVTELRDDFVRFTMPRLYASEEEGPLPQRTTELSRLELRRIERALYRFQIYCNLFGDEFRNGVDKMDTKRPFFECPSWVNEQLSCVCDFLEAQITEAMNLVVDQLPDRSDFIRKGSKSRLRQHYLSLGIPFLHQLKTAPSPEEKLDLLQSTKDVVEDRPSAPAPEIESGFELDPDASDDWARNINEIVRASDPNEGPMLAWKEVNENGGSRDMMMVVDHGLASRRLGYVMWDVERSAEPQCRVNLDQARRDATPTFIAPGKLMRVAKAWDQQFRAASHPAVRPRANRPSRH